MLMGTVRLQVLMKLRSVSRSSVVMVLERARGERTARARRTESEEDMLSVGREEEN